MCLITASLQHLCMSRNIIASLLARVDEHANEFPFMEDTVKSP